MKNITQSSVCKNVRISYCKSGGFDNWNSEILDNKCANCEMFMCQQGNGLVSVAVEKVTKGHISKCCKFKSINLVKRCG